jgi:magnesium-transporting ATPase (P-type)
MEILLNHHTNQWILGGIGLMAVLQLMLTYLPVFNRLFHTAPIGLDSWARILAAAVISYGIVAIEKRLRRRRGGHHGSAPL